MHTRLEHARANVANRVTIVEPLFDTPYGTRKFTIADPDGNELGFVDQVA